MARTLKNYSEQDPRAYASDVVALRTAMQNSIPSDLLELAFLVRDISIGSGAGNTRSTIALALIEKAIEIFPDDILYTELRLLLIEELSKPLITAARRL